MAGMPASLRQPPSAATRRLRGLRFDKTRTAAGLLIAMIFVQIPLGRSANSHINVYHLLLLLLPVLYFPALRYLKLNPATAFIGVMTVTSCFAAVDYGGGLRSTLVLFIALAYFLGVVFGRKLEDEELRKIFVGVLCCCFAFVVLRDLAFANQLGAIYARSTDAYGVLYMSTGGRNIEASLLALLSILLLGTRAYPWAALLALLTSATMLSRSGLIGTAVSVLIAAYRMRKTREYYLYLFAGIAMMVLLAGLVLSQVIDVPVLDRFNLKQETQLEQKNVGRLALWNTAHLALDKNMLGYGVGNGVPVMEQLSGLKFVENNVHDIYLQFFLEGGIQSALLFLLLAGHILLHKSEGEQRNIKYFLLCYLLLAFIEFSGYEAYFWFFAGMFYARSDKRRAAGRKALRLRRRQSRQPALHLRGPAPALETDHVR